MKFLPSAAVLLPGPGMSCLGQVSGRLDHFSESCENMMQVMKYKAATPITGLDIGLKREWLIGQQLNQLADSKGQLQGYMKTGAAIVNSEDLLEGLIIEKVNGWPLEKR